MLHLMFGQIEEYASLPEWVHAGALKGDGELKTISRWQSADDISENDATQWHVPVFIFWGVLIFLCSKPE